MRLDPRRLVFEGGRFKPANAVTLSRGVAIAPILGLLLAGRHSAALVVGYGTPPDHAFTGALTRLVAVLTQR